MDILDIQNATVKIRLKIMNIAFVITTEGRMMIFWYVHL